MTDYIITCDDEVAMWVSNDVESMRPLVRCRDCKHYHPELYNNISCEWFMFDVGSDGFCAWGAPRFITCKCGESIELGDREYAVCPSCGRTVRE